jgi:hypothetical protein
MSLEIGDRNSFALVLAYDSFRAKKVPDGMKLTNEVRDVCPEAVNSIYGQMWVIKGKRNIGRYGEHCFCHTKNYESTAEEKAQAINQYLKSKGINREKIPEVLIQLYSVARAFQKNDVNKAKGLFREVSKHRDLVYYYMWQVCGKRRDGQKLFKDDSIPVTQKAEAIFRVIQEKLVAALNSTSARAAPQQAPLRQVQTMAQSVTPVSPPPRLSPIKTIYRYEYGYFLSPFPVNPMNNLPGTWTQSDFLFSKLAPEEAGELYDRLRRDYQSIQLSSCPLVSLRSITQDYDEKAQMLKSRLTADIVFVGAGPVGIWTAILTKLANRGQHIHMIEKRTTYQRTQELHVHPATFQHSHVQDPRLDSLVDGLTALGELIPIQTLEARLLAFARDIGIQIEYYEVLSPGCLSLDFPKARHFIGSDGASSKFREAFFGQTSQIGTTESYQAHVTYRVNGEAKSIHPDSAKIDGFISKLFLRIAEIFTSSSSAKDSTKWGLPWHWGEGCYGAIHAMTSPLLRERIQRADPHSFRLAFRISQDIFNQLMGATARTPFNLDQVPQSLRDDINLWCGVKKGLHGEEIVPGSLKITSVKLRATRSPAFVLHHDTAPTFGIGENTRRFTRSLIGDAAVGFAYELGAGFGISAGTELSKALTTDSFDRFIQHVEENIPYTLEKMEARESNASMVEWIESIPCFITRFAILHLHGRCFTGEEIRQYRALGGRANAIPSVRS